MGYGMNGSPVQHGRNVETRTITADMVPIQTRHFMQVVATDLSVGDALIVRDNVT
jgi:hypothetical protein